MYWCMIQSPAQALLVLLVAIGLYGLLAYGDRHGWWDQR